MNVEAPPLDNMPVSQPKHSHQRRWLVAAVFLLALIGLLWYVGVLGGNVRVVDSGRF